MVGVLSHECFVYDSMSALENLRFYAKMHEVDGSSGRLMELLEQVGLKKRANDPVAAMSRGMMQRLALARCLLHDPRVLFLDEPYTGLDPHGAGILTGHIKELRTRDRAILITTHRLERGLEVADRVGILVGGKLSFWADRNELDLESLERQYSAVAEGVR